MQPLPALDDIDLALRAATNLCEIAADGLLPYIRWTPPQDAWLRLNPPSGVKLFRAGNQAIGKTTAQMAETIWRATGTHPHYDTTPPPVEIWIVCTSWAQSVAIQAKFWTLCEKPLLVSRTRDRFRIDDGWGKDNPVAVFNCGSIVRFRTTNQGPEAQAGATVDYIGIDEPPDEAVFRELRKRVMRSGGQMGLTLSPVNRPTKWIHAQVDQGMIDEVHAKLTPANLIPLGSRRPLEAIDPFTRKMLPMDAAWIAHQRKITPAMWAPVVLDGEWDIVPEGRFFTCFDAKKHISSKARLDPARGQIQHLLGIDYATADRPYGHVAALVAVQQFRDSKGRLKEAIHILDEVALSGTATSAEFAQRTISMLDRNGLRWTDLYRVHGDNPVTSRWAQKSNINTMKALGIELGIPFDAVSPRILNAKDATKSAGSLSAGAQYLFERIATGNVFVHPRAETVAKGLDTWDFSAGHPLKDACDAVRYALKPYIFAAPNAGVAVLRLAR